MQNTLLYLQQMNICLIRKKKIIIINRNNPEMRKVYNSQNNYDDNIIISMNYFLQSIFVW